MTIETFIRVMPKVEMHVHLEGSTRPATLLKLASRHPVAPPANPVEGERMAYIHRLPALYRDLYCRF